MENVVMATVNSVVRVICKQVWGVQIPLKTQRGIKQQSQQQQIRKYNLLAFQTDADEPYKSPDRKSVV